MGKKKKKLVIILIIVLVVVLFDVFIAINYLVKVNNTEDEVQVDESDINETETDGNVIQDEEERFYKIEQSTDSRTYFLMNKCLESYLNIGTSIEMLDVIDKEVINEFQYNEDTDFNIGGECDFCIDNIYNQYFSSSLSAYIVKYRVSFYGEECLSNTIIIKVDSKNKSFSIYPYEYLEKYNYLDVGSIQYTEIESSEIIQNDNNKYDDSDISTDELDIVRELNRRYKFDVQVDIDHLYSTINKKYKEIKFPSEDDLKIYIEKNKSKIYSEVLQKYTSNELKNSTEYVAVTSEDSCYIFQITSLMNYRILLDRYTVQSNYYRSMYDGSFPEMKAKYCIERVINAINNKDFEFVYGKLNEIQKNNFYKNYDDFVTFLSKTFYDKNNCEYSDSNEITDLRYQYEVTISDKNNENGESKIVICAVTINEDDDDFQIAIKLKDN